MLLFDLKNEKIRELFRNNKISIELFSELLELVKQSNTRFYHLSSEITEIYEKLTMGKLRFQTKFKSLKDRQIWEGIRDLKTGDRGYINRFLLAEIKTNYSDIYLKVIDPIIAGNYKNQNEFSFDLSDELYALYLTKNVTSLFKFITEIDNYKQGVFNPISRKYVSFIQDKILNILADFLKAYELNLAVLQDNLLSKHLLSAWDKIELCIENLAQRADKNHHDPLALNEINCLRSIYVSFFNINMLILRTSGQVPQVIRNILPIIPDKLDFSKNSLKLDGFWERYQEHHFLFMKLPSEHKISLQKAIKNLSKKEKIGWIGSLGAGEIKNMILPMAKNPARFISITESCNSITAQDSSHAVAHRVKASIEEVYSKYLCKHSSTPPEVHQLFKQLCKDSESSSLGSDSDKQIGKKALEMIKNLKFMVVDDSEKIRDMTVDVLKKAGSINILEAEDGCQAWELLKQHNVNVVLCDWIMPKVDGLELLKMIKADNELNLKITFIMLTTVDDKMSIVEALGAGARGYLIKPFSRNQLFEKVYFACEWLHKEQKKQIWKKKLNTKHLS